MNIAIVGFATEGQESFAYYQKQGGHELTICDQNDKLKTPWRVPAQLGNNYLDNMGRFDLIVRSAGIPGSLILEKNPDSQDKITTQINEFIAQCPSKNIIGVTGTKGKGTTSTLITEILKAAGKRVFLGGNIGLPPFSFIDQVTADDWVVLELSSYQLSDLTHSPHIAVCLKVVPEHLDWHGTMLDYKNAKANLFRHQETDDIAIYFASSQDSEEIASASPGQKIPYFTAPGAFVDGMSIKIDDQVICETEDIGLLGKHNWQNVCAAVTVTWPIVQDVSVISQVVQSFKGLPHRIEFVRTLNEIAYYNDSFASGQGATLAAIEAVKEPKVVIIGGYDRNLDLSDLVEGLKKDQESIRKVMLIGASSDRTASALEEGGFHNFVKSNAKTMQEVVADAQKEAQPGDAILLSPGFASFDMFKNFEDRGNQFRAVVEAL